MVQLLYILLYVFYAGLFVWCILNIKFFETQGAGKKLLAGFFILKILAGILLTLVYTYYYTDPTKADIYRYFNDSKVISSVLFTNPAAWLKIMSGVGINNPDTFRHLMPTEYFSHPANDMVTSNSFFIRIVAVLNYLSFYNIYINTLLLNFLTFTGLVILYKTVRPYFIEFELVLYIPFFLLPSVVFWSSGQLKESVLLFGICVYLSAWPGFNNSPLWKSVLFMLLGIAVVALTKIYIAVLLVLFTGFLPLPKTFSAGQFYILKRFIFYLVAGMVVWRFSGQFFCEKIIDKRNEFTLLALSEKAGSALDTKLLAADCSHLLSIVPASFVNSVFRPFIWDSGAVFQILFAVENFMLLVFIVAMLIMFFKKPGKQKLHLAVFCFLFALSNYLIIGLTVPVMGAIVHYRVVAVPFLLIGVLLLLDLEKMKKRLRLYK